MDKHSYLIDLAESYRTNYGRVTFSAQSQEQRVFSAVWALMTQMDGGFEQFFENEERDLVLFAPEALRAMGAITCAAIVSDAIALAPNIDSPETFDDLGILENSYSAYPDDLTELLFAYVVAHPEVFGRALDGA